MKNLDYDFMRDGTYEAAREACEDLKSELATVGLSSCPLLDALSNTRVARASSDMI